MIMTTIIVIIIVKNIFYFYFNNNKIIVILQITKLIFKILFKSIRLKKTTQPKH